MLPSCQNILGEKRQRVFTRLAAFAEEGYLAGGTALSLQLVHRRSFDFDIFLDQAIDNQLRRKVRSVFPGARILFDNSDQLDIVTKTGIKVTWLWYYFPRLKELVKPPDLPLPLASLEDIATDKAHALGRRAVWRDYVDLFFIFRRTKLDLAQLIRLARRKFRSKFNAALFLEQLIYFTDLEADKIVFLGKSYHPSEIQKFLEHQVKQYLTQQKLAMIK